MLALRPGEGRHLWQSDYPQVKAAVAAKSMLVMAAGRILGIAPFWHSSARCFY
jgi:hypothetical protein